MGKNCGGTLGAPLERMFGQEELFGVHWYPAGQNGGIPNDDLELQLIWLKAVEEQGFDLTARDLAAYWLNHVGYNFDEYGMSKTNLRLGLAPPVSGSFNNWFRDCMGSPIRSEIWACLAPGVPDIAVHFAYQDAIVDHAGGEGVWGELFNAAIESAAFVIRDVQRLLDIGLSYIPIDCLTSAAIRAAREAHRAGCTWREARRRVLEAAPHYVAQYAPPNLGFQVVGLLYGQSFGDALCTTVNCGYDTDCTAASVGALLGILHGSAGIPEAWSAPIGNAITTNESWGGLRDVSNGNNPVPTSLEELTNRICSLGERMLLSRQAPIHIGRRTDLRDLEESSLLAQPGLSARYENSGDMRASEETTAVAVSVSYGDAPVITPNVPKTLRVNLRNQNGMALDLDVDLAVPDGWHVVSDREGKVHLAADTSTTVQFTIEVDGAHAVSNSNASHLQIRPVDSHHAFTMPLTLVGARRWQLKGRSGPDGATAVELLELPFEPEVDIACTMWGEGSGWTQKAADGNAVPVLDPNWTGVLYTRLFLWSNEPQDVRIGVPATCPRKLWINGQLVHTVRDQIPLRPNYGHKGGDGASFGDWPLRQRWNVLLIKYARSLLEPPFEAHLTLSTTDLQEGVIDLGWTRLPWDAEAARA